MSDVKEEKETNSINSNVPIPPRSNLVETAAEFLSFQNVQYSPMEPKIMFLKKKGLSDAEIDLALKQSEVIIQSRTFQSKQQLYPYIHSLFLNHTNIPPWSQHARWSKCRDIVDAIALIGGLTYTIYWFHKKYIAPLLFGSKKNSLETRLSEIDTLISTSMTEIKADVSKVRKDIEKLSEQRVNGLTRQVEELKNEVSSLKKLLLSSRQFPATPVAGPISIPSWQIASTEDKEAEEEGEHSGTSGSDSSLEMIIE